MIDDVIDNHQTHVNSGMARLMKLLNVTIEAQGEGAMVIDHKGEHYLDCGGYCVFLLGRNHPDIVQVAKDQLDKVALGSRLLINKEIATAAQVLSEIAPKGLQYVWFANSGAEAVEAAIKLCKVNGRHRFIAMEGGFHGKTTGALSLTHNPAYREPFLPLMPGVEFIKFDDAAALKLALADKGDETVVVMEPLQSEAGVVIAKDGYLAEVAKLCRDNNALLVMDEISTGLGRTGHWWYCQQEQVEPDILLCGKALGGGVLPVSAMLCKEELYAVYNKNPILHTSTFAGSPLVARVVTQTIQCLQAYDAPKKAKELGEQINTGIEKILAKHHFSFIKEVRQKGLLIAIEFEQDMYSGEFLMEMISRKIIVSHSLNAHKTVRLTPSILLTNDNIEFLLTAIEAAFLTIHQRYK